MVEHTKLAIRYNHWAGGLLYALGNQKTNHRISTVHRHSALLFVTHQQKKGGRGAKWGQM